MKCKMFVSAIGVTIVIAAGGVAAQPSGNSFIDPQLMLASFDDAGGFSYFTRTAGLTHQAFGGPPSRWLVPSHGARDIEAMVEDATAIYWVDAGTPGGDYHDGMVYKTPKSGAATEVLAWGQMAPKSIAIDGSHVYWTNLSTAKLGWGEGSVMRVPKNGGDATPVAIRQFAPTGIVVDGVNAYWLSNGLQRAPVTGGTPTRIASAGGGMLALDANSVYYTISGLAQIWRIPKAGGTPAKLTAGESFTDVIATDGMFVYFGSDRGAVRKVSVNGGASVEVAPGGASPGGHHLSGISVRGNYIEYWSKDDSRIQRALNVSGLGQACQSNSGCTSGRCDAANGNAHLCIPNDRTGRPGDYCSHPNQCGNGNCINQHCMAGVALGQACGGNQACASGRCDNAPGNLPACIPNDGTGNPSDYCSHNNQCRPGIPCNIAPGRRDGLCASGAALGQACGGNQTCASGRCDNAPGNRAACIPNDGWGNPGDYCSHNNQCRPGHPCNIALGRRDGTCG